MISDFVSQFWKETPDAIVIISGDGNILDWNHAAECIFGYSRAETINRHLGELIVPADRIAEEHDMREQARQQGLVVFESVRRRKDGSLVQLSISTKAVHDSDENLQYFISITKDITNQNVMRDAKWLEAKFGNLLDSTPDAIVICNECGRIVLVNAHAESMFGYPRTQLVNQSIEVLLPHRLRAAYIGHLESYFFQPKTQPIGVESDLYGLRKNGEEFSIEINLSPIDAENGKMVMSSIRDVTKRKKAEKKFYDLLESAPDAMIIVNLEGSISVINSQAEKLFGYSRQELLGKQFELLIPDRLHAQTSQRHTKFFGQSQITAAELPLEQHGRHKDGTEFPIEITLSPLQTEDGMVVSTAIRDITQRKQAELALRLSHEKLHELIAYQERIKESERIRIAREIHDELGSLLTGIKANLAVVMKQDERAGRVANERLEDACLQLETALDTVRKVITDLRPSVLDNLGVWTALEWLTKQTEGRAGIKCDFSICATAAKFVLDAERSTVLFRILQETLTNVTRHADASQVNVKVALEDGNIKMEVEDDGKGIDAVRRPDGRSWGIAGMTERARYFGGDISIADTSHGTLMRLHLPLHSHSPDGSHEDRRQRILDRRDA